MTLAYEGMDMEAHHGLTFTVYTATREATSPPARLPPSHSIALHRR